MYASFATLYCTCINQNHCPNGLTLRHRISQFMASLINNTNDIQLTNLVINSRLLLFSVFIGLSFLCLKTRDVQGGFSEIPPEFEIWQKSPLGFEKNCKAKTLRN